MPHFDPEEFGHFISRLTPHELRQAEELVTSLADTAASCSRSAAPRPGTSAPTVGGTPPGVTWGAVTDTWSDCRSRQARVPTQFADTALASVLDGLSAIIRIFRSGISRSNGRCKAARAPSFEPAENNWDWHPLPTIARYG